MFQYLPIKVMHMQPQLFLIEISPGDLIDDVYFIYFLSWSCINKYPEVQKCNWTHLLATRKGINYANISCLYLVYESSLDSSSLLCLCVHHRKAINKLKQEMFIMNLWNYILQLLFKLILVCHIVYCLNIVQITADIITFIKIVIPRVKIEV